MILYFQNTNKSRVHLNFNSSTLSFFNFIVPNFSYQHRTKHTEHTNNKHSKKMYSYHDNSCIYFQNLVNVLNTMNHSIFIYNSKIE